MKAGASLHSVELRQETDAGTVGAFKRSRVMLEGASYQKALAYVSKQGRTLSEAWTLAIVDDTGQTVEQFKGKQEAIWPRA